MPKRRDPRGRGWFFRKMVRLPDGRRERIFGVPGSFGLPNTKRGAEEAELREINRVMKTGVVKVNPPKKEVTTVRAFAETFLATSNVQNKPSSVESKEAILRLHVVPLYGDRGLDELDYAAIEDMKVELAKTLSAKTVNNVLTVVRRMLVVARKRKLIKQVPEVEWLKTPPAEFDFLTFEEAERMVARADEEWAAAMMLIALRTGLRQGELLGLRWEDVDLVAGKLSVRQAMIVRGKVTTPKSNKHREVPQSEDALTTLKRQRYLRGPLVFCDADGRALTKGACKWPLYRAAKMASLRRIGWHVLRHSFASHLVMRGAPIKVVQELLGHATITMRYAHLAPEVKRDAVKLLDGATPSWRGSDLAADPRIGCN